MRTWISQWFLAKKLFLFYKNNFTRINHCKIIHHKSHLKHVLSYLPCIVRREYLSIIFNIKKCTLYLIKHGKHKIIIIFIKLIGWNLSCWSKILCGMWIAEMLASTFIMTLWSKCTSTPCKDRHIGATLYQPNHFWETWLSK